MLTKYAASKLINHLLGIDAFTMPTTVYLCLFTADPTTDGAFTNEVPSSRGYARQDATSVMSTSAGGVASESESDVSFGPDITGDWGLITHVGLVDNATLGAGNLLTYKALGATYQRTIRIGDTFKVPSGSLTEAMS